MRGNIGIDELSSPLLRDLLREACAPIGRVTTFTTLEEARAAFAQHPPKIMIIGGAPLDTELLELLDRAVHSHGVIGLALADAHDLQRAQRAGALEGFPRTPEGLRALSLRLRPLLAPSLRPPSDEIRRRTGQSDQNILIPSLAGSGSAPPAAPGSQCSVIAMGSFSPHSDATTYLLSRLPTNLPGIVLVQVSLQLNASELAEALADECAWRVNKVEGEQRILPGGIWVADGSASLQLRMSADGPVLLRTPATPPRITNPVDALFESAARSLGPSVLGVLLAAGGEEGTRGIRAMRRAGCYTFAQRESSSVHPQSSPPRATADAGAHEVLGLERLPPAITAYCSSASSYRSLRPGGR